MSQSPVSAVGPPAQVDDRVVRVRRWTVGVLAASTAVLLAYVAFLALAMWMIASALSGPFGWGAVSVDWVDVARDVGPVLLVGWCTGMAASAVVVRWEALGARSAGLVAGSVGTAAGAVVVAVTDLF
jgi:hypothetical protein